MELGIELQIKGFLALSFSPAPLGTSEQKLMGRWLSTEQTWLLFDKL